MRALVMYTTHIYTERELSTFIIGGTPTIRLGLFSGAPFLYSASVLYSAECLFLAAAKRTPPYGIAHVDVDAHF